jgi:hypothetical protein
MLTNKRNLPSLSSELKALQCAKIQKNIVVIIIIIMAAKTSNKLHGINRPSG